MCVCVHQRHSGHAHGKVNGIVGLVAAASAVFAVLFALGSVVKRLMRDAEEKPPRYLADMCVFDGFEEFNPLQPSTLRRPSTVSYHITHTSKSSPSQRLCTAFQYSRVFV